MRMLGIFLVYSISTVLVVTSLAHELTPGNWKSCEDGQTAPPTRVNTADKIQLLRTYFSTEGIQAYLIPNEDAHQSEYPSEYDKRRGYISGFRGSSGYAVITIDKQALWTDGRYFLEAEDTLDCNWILMRLREKGVPSMIRWLKDVLPSGSRLGVSPYLISSSSWKTDKIDLEKNGMGIKAVQQELIDIFWTVNNGRPAQPNTDINALPQKFAGKRWQDKVEDVRTAMAEKDVDMMVVTSLDDTAWLFNLRATDVSYNPFFISYAIVTNSHLSLYLLDHLNKIQKVPTDNETSANVAEHLNTDPNTGSCFEREGICVNVKLYDDTVLLDDIASAQTQADKVWLSFSCNQAIYAKVDENKIHQDITPIATSKTIKNPTEAEGMRTSHIRDAVALISFLAMLETEVIEGKNWSELSAAARLKEYRADQMYNRGLSFASISGFGSNGAIIHYRPNELTNKNITTDGVYLLDSGGQYLDGTTDVTRTFHFGEPTDYQKECYTRVLMGQINLFHTIFPKGLYGKEIDAFARAALWDVGLIYRHGTGHGIGMYLSVHEGPGRISLNAQKDIKQDNILDENQFFSDDPIYLRKSSLSKSKQALDEHMFMSNGPIFLSKSSGADSKQKLDEYMFISDEPGYYEDGEFGMRLENIVMIRNATTKFSFPDTQFLAFEHVTLVPYEPKLIKYDLLNENQINYLNDYHKLCREKVGPELQEQGYTEGYDWMMEKSKPYEPPKADKSSNTNTNTAPCTKSQLQIAILLALIALLL